MENQHSITDNIRAIVVTRQEIISDPTAPVTATKEEIIREMKEKYPSFSDFDIENAFEELKMNHHLEEQEGSDVFVFTEAFIFGK